MLWTSFLIGSSVALATIPLSPKDLTTPYMWWPSVQKWCWLLHSFTPNSSTNWSQQGTSYLSTGASARFHTQLSSSAWTNCGSTWWEHYRLTKPAVPTGSSAILFGETDFICLSLLKSIIHIRRIIFLQGINFLHSAVRPFPAFLQIIFSILSDIPALPSVRQSVSTRPAPSRSAGWWWAECPICSLSKSLPLFHFIYRVGSLWRYHQWWLFWQDLCLVFWYLLIVCPCIETDAPYTIESQKLYPSFRFLQQLYQRKFWSMHWKGWPQIWEPWWFSRKCQGRVDSGECFIPGCSIWGSHQDLAQLYSLNQAFERGEKE